VLKGIRTRFSGARAIERRGACTSLNASTIVAFFGVQSLLLGGMGCRSVAPVRTSSPASEVQATPATLVPRSDSVLAHHTFTIASKALGETRVINVYTPPGYEQAVRARYPVLYMPDGGAAEDFPHVTTTIDTAIRAHDMRPVIVIGIENTERRRDMTGPTTVESDRKIARRVGGSAAFRAFIRDELMPVIRQRYRGNGETGIVGESLAGLFILETFFEEPELFDSYIALSPSLWWNAQSLLLGAEERLRSRPRLRATLYLSVAGDDDVDDAVRKLATTLRPSAPEGLTWYFEFRPDEKHSTIYRAASPVAFRKLYPPLAEQMR